MIFHTLTHLMYETVRGNRPHTQGEQLVNKPAAYMMGSDVMRLLGSASSVELAKLPATDWAWYTTSSHCMRRAVLCVVVVVGVTKARAGWVRAVVMSNSCKQRTSWRAWVRLLLFAVVAAGVIIVIERCSIK